MSERLAAVDVDFVLERFDQTEPALQRQIVAELVRALAEARRDGERLEYLRTNGYINTGCYTTSMLARHTESLDAFRAALDAARESCGECDEGWRGDLASGTLRRCENGCYSTSGLTGNDLYVLTHARGEGA